MIDKECIIFLFLDMIRNRYCPEIKKKKRYKNNNVIFANNGNTSLNL